MHAKIQNMEEAKMSHKMFERSSGVLLHVTSLPSRFGVGDLGSSAVEWIDWLSTAGVKYWQVLPLGPTGYGDSPYSSLSSFAGNTTMVAPESLASDGLLSSSELMSVGNEESVEFDTVKRAKDAWLRLAHSRLEGGLRAEFEIYREVESDWLAPYALFMALKEAHGGQSWSTWPRDLRHRQSDAIAAARTALADEIEVVEFSQFAFYRQLNRLREHAKARGVEIIGDVPLYVAPDCVDAWVDPQLFSLDDETGEPTLVAGVPPDMFSKVGQHWGNPLYQWEAHAEDGYRWWFDRLEGFFRQADVIRIDHFTGLVRYYEIQGSATDASDGVWRDGPGLPFFDEMNRRMGEMPIILEDLGPIPEIVEGVRRRVGYPGMAIVQEGFAGDKGSLPSNLRGDRVAYTGTHDNDTALGRFLGETDEYREAALAVTGGSAETYSWDLLRELWASQALITIVPMQDLLGLGTEARMNYPGTAEGNWRWRMTDGAATPELAERIGMLNGSHGRLGG